MEVAKVTEAVVWAPSVAVEAVELAKPPQAEEASAPEPEPEEMALVALQ